MSAVVSRDAFPISSRYRLITKIASGGMATVYVGALRGAGGFERVVAIKRAHPHLLDDPAFRRMLIAEARVAARTDHPNVVGVKDVEELDGELLLIMDYVEGASLSRLLSASNEAELPVAVAVRIMVDACEGLNAVHALTDDDGAALGVVHRDVSPQNILVGIDGVSRIADFGIAKTTEMPGFCQGTATGALRGKPGYMAPEYVETGVATPMGDIFALGVVAWEALTRRRLFRGNSDLETLDLLRHGRIPNPSEFSPEIGPSIDAVVHSALTRDPFERVASARAFGTALEAAARADGLLASRAEVQTYVTERTAEDVKARKREIRVQSSHAWPVASVPSNSEVRLQAHLAEPLSGSVGSAGSARSLGSPDSVGSADALDALDRDKTIPAAASETLLSLMREVSPFNTEGAPTRPTGAGRARTDSVAAADTPPFATARASMPQAKSRAHLPMAPIAAAVAAAVAVVGVVSFLVGSAGPASHVGAAVSSGPASAPRVAALSPTETVAPSAKPAAADGTTAPLAPSVAVLEIDDEAAPVLPLAAKVPAPKVAQVTAPIAAPKPSPKPLTPAIAATAPATTTTSTTTPRAPGDLPTKAPKNPYAH